MQVEESLFEKIRSLPAEKKAEVEDFVDFLRQKSEDRALVQEGRQLSEKVFQKIWDNPEDADYDRL
ncbi:MAG TPA: toxin-antitoxin system, antitoxin component, Xre family protein [Deltaproteobacteria bacterium]|nr:toxin-antitoxin system, antitoxin component, Xre family protein [Deltaproteobacteria bacterium]